jgi:hypothetical protein
VLSSSFLILAMCITSAIQSYDVVLGLVVEYTWSKGIKVEA